MTTDTEIRLAQCPRCEGYVFQALSCGINTAADPGPVTRDGYAAALAGGRRLFDLLTVAGRPSKLLARLPGANPPSFDPQGLQDVAGRSERPVLAEHGCGAHGMDASRVEVVPTGKASAPATRGVSRAGSPREIALAGASRSTSPRKTGQVPSGQTFRNPARAATPRRSRRRIEDVELPPPCDSCGKFIGAGEPYTGLKHGSDNIWAIHEECRNDN